MAVVDYDRLKRLELPDTGGLNTLTKFYILVIFISVIFLIKRYRDKSLKPS